MTDPGTLRRDWSTVYTKDRSKTHIMPSCPYVTDDHRKRPIAAFPVAHIDLCEWCEERFEAWRESMDGDEDRCDRCGHRYDGLGAYCEGCHAAAERAKLQR